MGAQAGALAVQSLTALADDSSEWVRRNVAEALGTIGQSQLQQDVTLVLLANHNCDVWDLSWQIHELILEHLPEQRQPLFTVA
jgi:HEAT repeat protein